MVERRDVELLVRAKNLSAKPLRDVSTALDQISSSLAKQVEAARKGEVSYQELADSFRQVQEAGRSLSQTQGLIDRFSKLNAESARLADRVRESATALRDFRVGMEAGGAVTTKQENQLRRLQTAYDRAKASLEKNTTAIQATRESLEGAGVDTRNLAAAQQQIVASAAEAGNAATTLSTAMSGYARNAREAAQASKALKEAQAFQGLAAQANEAVAAAQRLATATGRITSTSGGFGAGLRAIADPAGEARRTLAGLEGEIANLGAEVAKVNGPVRNYSETLLQLTAAQNAAIRSADLVDRFRQQADVLRQTRAQFVAAHDAVRNYQQQVQASSAPNADLAAKLKQAEATLAGLARQYRTAADATRVTRDALREAGVDTRNLSDAQTRLEQAVRRSTDSVGRLNAAFAQFGSAGRGGQGIFGLSPYQVQNLGFQINDFFTQLASGTSVSQAFAQQFGQVVQVFGPGSFSQFSRWIPLLGAFGAAVGVATAALSRLYETQSSNRNFQANLSLLGSGAGAGVSADQLTQVARSVERLGFDFDDARKAALRFLRDGLAPANIAPATEAAARLSRVLGIDVADAAKLVAEASRGSSTALRSLEEAGFRFTAGQRQAIEAAKGTSDEFQRQQQILSILTQRFREADEQGLSPWTRAVIAAREAWRGLLDEVGNSAPLQIVKGLLDSLGASLQNIRTYAQIAARALFTAFAPLQVLLTEIRRIGQSMGLFGGQQAGTPSAPTTPGAPTGQDPVGGDTPADRRVYSEVQRRELELIRDDERRSRREREAAARRLIQLEVEAENATASRLAQNTLVNIRLAEFRKRLDDEAEKNGRRAGEQIRRDFAAIQQDVQNTVRVRDEAIRGIQEDVASGAETPANAVRRIQEAADQARPALQRLAEEARRFRDQNQGGDAVRRAALDSLVAQAERQAGAAGSRAGVRQVLQTQGGEVQRLIQERQQFVQTQDARVNLNQITQQDAEAQTAEFYRQTNDELVRQIDLLQQAAEAARSNGDISDAAFRQISASVELYRAQLERVDPAVVRLRNTIEQGFVQSISTALDTAAKAFGDFIAGVQTLEDAFDQAGKAALQFFADFLKSIAQAIIQQQALIVAKQISAAIGGVFHSGGVVGQTAAPTRAVSSAWFANAPRMHSGGIAGLRPDEVPAILQRGEEVLSKSDPRNILNGGGAPAAAAPATPVRNVLAVGDDEIANAMSGAAGESVVLNILRRNAPTVRQYIR